MKILFINEGLGGGGAERQLSLIANEFSDKGYDVTLATWAPSQAPDVYPLSAGVRRLRLRSRNDWRIRFLRHASTLRAFSRLIGLLRTLRPDVVVSFSEASNILAVMAGRLTRRPIIVSLRTNPEQIFRMKPHWRKPAIRAYRRADAVVAQTEAVASWCLLTCRRHAHVIPNSLRKLPSALEDEGRKPIIASVGSLIAYKGHDVLIRAFARIHDKFPDWRLLILGEGPQRGLLTHLAEELGISKKVELRGFTSDIERALNTARIFVLPSRFEGFPNALIEAMGMGLACVATDCDYGPREIVDARKNGLLVPVDDDRAMASALEQLMEDREFRLRLARNAQSIQTTYSVERTFKSWRDLIDSIGGSDPNGSATADG